MNMPADYQRIEEELEMRELELDEHTAQHRNDISLYGDASVGSGPLLQRIQDSVSKLRTRLEAHPYHSVVLASIEARRAQLEREHQEAMDLVPF